MQQLIRSANVPVVKTVTQMAARGARLSAASREGLFDRNRVAASELDGMHDQWSQLMHGYTVPPTLAQGKRLIVGGEALRSESTEEPHHR